MSTDSALSHLSNDELCIVEMTDGNRYEVRWSQPHWCFYAIGIAPPVACDGNDITEWWPASIAF